MTGFSGKKTAREFYSARLVTQIFRKVNINNSFALHVVSRNASHAQVKQY
jgi:hypothetical protein